jgi:hypothetical protein
MATATYAVQTATCTYLLDDAGVCRWIQTPPGVLPPPGVERCIGAQFVAALDLEVERGLVGELRVGAAALFVREEHGRLVMLRTLPMLRVDTLVDPSADARAAIEDPPSFAETPVRPDQVIPAPRSSAGIYDEITHDAGNHPQPSEVLGVDPRWSLPGEALDLEDLLSISVTEVTLTLPLYRPPPRVPPPPPPPHPPPVRRGRGPA